MEREERVRRGALARKEQVEGIGRFPWLRCGAWWRREGKRRRDRGRDEMHGGWARVRGAAGPERLVGSAQVEKEVARGLAGLSSPSLFYLPKAVNSKERKRR